MKLDTRVPRPVRQPRVRTRERPLTLFASDRQGIVPASGGGTAKFLRADGAWAELPASPVLTVRLAADHSIASAAATKVSGFDIGLAVATYEFRYSLIVQSTNVLVGLTFGVNFTGTLGRVVVTRRYVSTGVVAPTGVMTDTSAIATGAFVEGQAARALSTTAPNLPNTGVLNPDQDCLTIVEGVLVADDVGTLELWHASESAVTTTVEAGSVLVVTRAA